MLLTTTTIFEKHTLTNVSRVRENILNAEISTGFSKLVVRKNKFLLASLGKLIQSASNAA